MPKFDVYHALIYSSEDAVDDECEWHLTSVTATTAMAAAKLVFAEHDYDKWVNERAGQEVIMRVYDKKAHRIVSREVPTTTFVVEPHE